AAFARPLAARASSTLRSAIFKSRLLVNVISMRLSSFGSRRFFHHSLSWAVWVVMPCAGAELTAALHEAGTSTRGGLLVALVPRGGLSCEFASRLPGGGKLATCPTPRGWFSWALATRLPEQVSAERIKHKQSNWRSWFTGRLLSAKSKPLPIALK